MTAQEWHNKALELSENQVRMEELKATALEAMKFANLDHWTIGQQFNLMAYNEEITGAELNALRRYFNLPGRMF